MTAEDLQYQPSKEETLNLKRKENCFKVSGDKVFATLQGEGLTEIEGGTAGCPAVFFRLHFCNLHCGFPKGWQCDTGYTWDTRRSEFWKEPEDWSIEKTKTEIESSWQSKFSEEDIAKKRIVITGGEPLLQQGLIAKLISSMPDWKIEIETNGTIMPQSELLNCQINCSPKLSNSGNEKNRRFKPEVLEKINNWPVSWFKFVVNNQQDVLEIEEIVNQCHLKSEKILIMPEGLTKEAVADHHQEVEAAISQKGWQIIKRNQLIWYGPKRRT